MSIKARFINVIVRNEVLERVYPGGLAAYERDAANWMFASDEHLACISFMDEESVHALVARLERLGLQCGDDGAFRDIAIMSRWGKSLPCPWLRQGQGMYWLDGTEPGEVALTTREKRATIDEIVTRDAVNLALRYVETYRKADYEAMARMSTEGDALLAALLMFAETIVPALRDAAGDEIYLEAMDGSAVYPDDVSDLSPAMAVDLINSRGGIEGRRWSRDGVEMTTQMVVDIKFRMASALSALVDITAAATDRDADEVFRDLCDLSTQPRSGGVPRERIRKALVVVESAARAKTIEGFLGGDYTVLLVHASHAEDSKEHAADLKRALKKTGELILATDYDRQGETTAYYVAALLGVDPGVAKRITFTEITRDAVLEAFANPRVIDMNLVHAEEARRVVRDLVRYAMSPLPFRPLPASASMSVAVRLIVEREREILAFNPIEYWSVDVRLTPDGDPQAFLARLVEVPEGKLAASPDKKGVHPSAEADAAQHVERLNRASYRVVGAERKERKRSPAPPFTTSTLQQEAARKLGFSARKTMTLAQRLYEGVDLPGEGTVGLITYMRTDSLNIADSALREIAELVKTEYGPTYSLAEPRRYKTKSRSAQETHEAVRPTSVLRTPDQMSRILEVDKLRLYRLIWQRTVATQVADARFNQLGIDIEALAQDPSGDVRYGLRATGQTLVLDGFIRIYKEGRDDTADPDAESTLPELTVEQVLRMLEILPEQHLTQPPPRFSEASLVKTLEELGIGRPSTYESIISTIQDWGYVRLEEKRFYSEDVGMVVTDKLIEHFPNVVDVNFTAKLEEELDEIAEGHLGSEEMLERFRLKMERIRTRVHLPSERPEQTLDEECPLCTDEGRVDGKLQTKLGRFGEFIGCTNYPNCRYVHKVDASSTG